MKLRVSNRLITPNSVQAPLQPNVFRAITYVSNETTYIYQDISHIFKESSDIFKDISHIFKEISHIFKDISHIFRETIVGWSSHCQTNSFT